MTLHEAIQSMKNNNSEERFSQLMEIMIRNAERGLIEGVTVKDIKAELGENIEEENHDFETLIPVIYELQEAINEFGYLDNSDKEVLTESADFKFGEYIKEEDLSYKTIGELLQ